MPLPPISLIEATLIRQPSIKAEYQYANTNNNRLISRGSWISTVGCTTSREHVENFTTLPSYQGAGISTGRGMHAIDTSKQDGGTSYTTLINTFIKHLHWL